MTDALLICESARIDADGAPLLEGLSCTAVGPRVALVGDFSALFLLLAARAQVASGSVRILGRDAERAVPNGVVGLALADPPLPIRWKTVDYLTESAALLGHPAKQSRALANQVLTRLSLAPLADRRLEALSLVERRSVQVAHALLGEPEVLAVQDPLAGLGDQAQQHLVKILDLAADGRSLIASTPNLAPAGRERALVDRADAVLVLEAGTLVGSGGPARALTDGRRYRVTATKNAGALAQRLGEQGHRVEIAHPVDDAVARDPELLSRQVALLVVELDGDAGTDVILSTALDVEAPVVEMVPLGAARE